MIEERIIEKEEISFDHVSNLLDGMDKATRELLHAEEIVREREMLRQKSKNIDIVKGRLHILKTAYSIRDSIDFLRHLKLHSNKAAKLRKKMINGQEKKIIKLQRNMFKQFGKKAPYKSDREYRISNKVLYYKVDSHTKKYLKYYSVNKTDFEKLFRCASNNEKSKVSSEIKKIKEKRTKAINDKYPIRTAYLDESQVLKKVKNEIRPKTQYVFKELEELEVVNFCLDLRIPKVLSESASKLQKRKINKYHKSVQKKKRVTSKMEKDIMKLINLRDEKIDIELAISTLNDSYLVGDKKEKMQKYLTKEFAKRNKKEQKILYKINKDKEKIKFRNYLDSYQEYYKLHNLERRMTKGELSQQEKNACRISLSSKWDTILKREIFPEKNKADKPTDSDDKKRNFSSDLRVEVPTIKCTDNPIKTNGEHTNNPTKPNKNGKEI